MPRMIQEFQLEPRDGPQPVEMPIGGEILRIAVRGVDLIMWAIVDPTAPKRPRDFWVARTGHRIPPTVGAHNHVASCHFVRHIVFHVFDVTPPYIPGKDPRREAMLDRHQLQL